MKLLTYWDNWYCLVGTEENTVRLTSLRQNLLGTFLRISTQKLSSGGSQGCTSCWQSNLAMSKSFRGGTGFEGVMGSRWNLVLGEARRGHWWMCSLNCSRSTRIEEVIEAEAWHNVAGLESLKKDQERLLLKVQQLQWRPQRHGDGIPWTTAKDSIYREWSQPEPRREAVDAEDRAEEVS